MPSIIPKAYYCASCKTESKTKTCKCGAKCKPVPPYTVRFWWINEKGMVADLVKWQNELSEKVFLTDIKKPLGRHFTISSNI